MELVSALNQYSDNDDDDDEEDQNDYKLDNCDAKDVEDSRKDPLLNSESKSWADFVLRALILFQFFQKLVRFILVNINVNINDVACCICSCYFCS